MDGTDEKILDLLKGNARMSYQELGDAIGMSRVAAKKRVQKLEKDGVIEELGKKLRTELDAVARYAENLQLVLNGIKEKEDAAIIFAVRAVNIGQPVIYTSILSC